MTRSAMELSLVLTICGGIWMSNLPAAADDVVVSAPVSVKVNFEGELPKFLFFRGNVPEMEIVNPDEMNGVHTIQASFNRNNPSEIQLSVTAMWANDNYDMRRFNFLPSNTRKSVPVRFLEEGPNSVLFKEFNQEEAKKQTRAHCMIVDEDFDLRHFNYKRCFFLFSLYETNGRRHFDPAFDALKGAFDKYYRLISEKDYPLARDLELEREVLEYEADAATVSSVRKVFRDNRVAVGYFKGMISQISNAEVAPYKGVQKEASSAEVDPASIPTLQIETQLIKGRFVEEQARIEAQKGQAPKAINGITLDHFDGLSRKLETLDRVAPAPN